MAAGRTPTVQAEQDACPNVRQHVKGEPEGYIAWQEWARQKARTHRQFRCDGCGYFVIWTRRRAG